MPSRQRGHDFSLPTIQYEFNKRHFIARSLFIYVSTSVVSFNAIVVNKILYALLVYYGYLTQADPYADVDWVGGGVWVNFHRRWRRADDF